MNIKINVIVGKYVCNFAGRLVSGAELREIMNDLKEKNDYQQLRLIRIYAAETVDGRTLLANEEDGSFGRLINHSRWHPNLHQLKLQWFSIPDSYSKRRSALKMKIQLAMFVAKRQILPGEQLFWNYGDDYDFGEGDTCWQNDCYCSNCFHLIKKKYRNEYEEWKKLRSISNVTRIEDTINRVGR